MLIHYMDDEEETMRPKSVTKELWEAQDLLNEINVLLNHAGAKGDTFLARIDGLIKERDAAIALLDEKK
jgi:hypothetical protein